MKPLHESHFQAMESIKSLLLTTESQNVLKTVGLSQAESVNFQQAVTSVSCTSTRDVAKILGIAGNEPVWGRSRRVDKQYAHDYQSITLCLVVALLRSNRELLALYDTPQGAIVVARLTFDIWSWAGTLSFGIADEAGSSTHVIGTSVIKGQLVDYGKGKKALDQIVGELETLLDHLNVATRKNVTSYDESLSNTQPPPQQNGDIATDDALAEKAVASKSSEETSSGELSSVKEEPLPVQATSPAMESPHPLLDPPLRYVLSPSLRIRVPVYVKADQETEVLEYLESNTVIDVVRRTQLWLCIQRSPGQHGYIKEIFARPLQSNTPTGEVHHSSSSNSISQGYSRTSNSVIAKRWFLVTGVCIGLGVMVFGIAAIVASVVEQVCVLFFCATTHPFTQQAQVLNVLGFILLGIGVLTLLIGLAVRSSLMMKDLVIFW